MKQVLVFTTPPSLRLITYQKKNEEIDLLYQIKVLVFTTPPSLRLITYQKKNEEIDQLYQINGFLLKGSSSVLHNMI